jgi:hypothetical protein
MRLTKRRPRLAGLLAAACSAVLVAGGISVATAEPALAASCNTNGHVYLTSKYPWSIRYETDPIDRPTDDYQDFGGYGFSVYLKLGGNGLSPYSVPSWDVRSSNGGAFTLFGNRAGGNCVANERNFFPAAGNPGDVWTVTANYNTGNSGQLIRNQSHFRIFFVEPPPQDPYPPCPNPDYC